MENKKNEQFRDELIDFLTEQDLFSDVSVYCNGHAYRNDKREGYILHTTRHGAVYYDCGEADTPEYGNADGISMTFEGPLYEMLNYGDGSTEETLNKIGANYGCYMEQGHAWSLAFWPE